MVEARTGRTVREIFEDRRRGGVPRARDRGAARRARRPGADGRSPPRAASCCRAENRAAARAPTSTSCGCAPTPTMLAERVAQRRPPAAARRRPGWRRCAPRCAEREPLYDEVADVVVDVDGRVADEVADRASLDGGRRRMITVPVALGDRVLRRARRRRRASPSSLDGPARRAPAGRGRHAGRRSASTSTRASSTQVFTIGDGEDGQDARHGRGAVPRSSPAGASPAATCVVAVGGGRGHRRRRVRRRRVPPRRRRSCTSPTTLLGHGRRRDRRQDRREPARGQEPRRRVLAAGRGAVRHRRAGDAAAARVPQRAAARWRSTTSSPATTSLALPLDERVAALRRDQGRRGRRRRARGAAGGPCSTTATRSAHALETAGRYDLRHGEAVAIGLVYAAELAARARPHRRRPGRRAPRASSARYDLPTRAARRRSTPTSCVALMGRDKKAVDGLTFVLDGPRGVEVVDGRRPGGGARRAGRDGGDAMTSDDRAAALGPEPEPARRARAGDLRHRRRSTTTSPPRRGRGRAHGLDARAPAVEPRGRAGRRRSTARAAGAPRSSSTPARSPTTRGRIHDALAAFDGPMVELHLSNPNAREAWRHTSVIAPVATGTIVGLRRRRLPARGRRGGRAARRGRRRDRRCRAMDVAAARSTGSRARSPTAGCDALLVTKLVEHPLPHRLHRLGRRCCSSLPDELVFVTDGRYGEQAARAARRGRASTRAIEIGRPRQRSATLLVARAPTGIARLGLEADSVTWAQQRALRRPTGSPAPSSCRPRASSRRCAW